MSVNLGDFWPTLKPVVKQAFDSVVIPEIQKLEDKIGSENVKLVVEVITKALEEAVDNALS